MGDIKQGLQEESCFPGPSSLLGLVGLALLSLRNRRPCARLSTQHRGPLLGAAVSGLSRLGGQAPLPGSRGREWDRSFRKGANGRPHPPTPRAARASERLYKAEKSPGTAVGTLPAGAGASPGNVSGRSWRRGSEPPVKGQGGMEGCVGRRLASGQQGATPGWGRPGAQQPGHQPGGLSPLALLALPPDGQRGPSPTRAPRGTWQLPTYQPTYRPEGCVLGRRGC